MQHNMRRREPMPAPLVSAAEEDERAHAERPEDHGQVGHAHALPPPRVLTQRAQDQRQREALQRVPFQRIAFARALADTLVETLCWVTS